MPAGSPYVMFGFEEETESAYLRGQCWYLALAIREKTSLPIVGIWNRGTMHHVGAKLPNGMIVDIEGVWTEKQWLQMWDYEMEANNSASVDFACDTDPYWAAAVDKYSSDMLNEKLDSVFTLDETSNAIVSILQRRGML